MKKELFLHIGLPKTGTTYLQCQIQFNRDKLRSKGIYVPQTGQLVGRDHNLLALALQPERWEQFPADVSASLPGMWHDLLEEIDNCGCQTILITSEAFSWELKTQEQIKSVRDHLVNYDVKIVFCERNPYNFISSMYGHLIRTGRGPYSLDEFLREFPHYWSGTYQKKRWGEFFGDDNFLQLSYEEIKGESIFHRFLEALFPSHEVLAETFEKSPDVNPNLSFSPRFLRFMEELSANRIDVTPYVKLYSTVLPTMVPRDRQIVSPVEIDEAMERCGLEHDLLNGAASKTPLQRGTELASIPEQSGNELMERTRELVETRQLLRERTDMLEKLIAESAGKAMSISRPARFLANGLRSIFAAPLLGQRKLLEAHEEIKRLAEVLNQNQELVRIVEQRSRTIEYVANQNLFAAQYQIELYGKNYVESVHGNEEQASLFKAGQAVTLDTDYPLACASNDYLNPESTMEGVVRPTYFVRDCIAQLGPDMKCLDLGTGAAGLVFEFAMNGIFAIGVDGSDFCRSNRVGYWPLLKNNLFTCDITKPFSFLSKDARTPMLFDVVTMWEVLEHIAESDLPGLLSNIERHLGRQGYFIGSVSLVEYVDSVGNPYHVTLKPREWWKTKFNESGLVMLDSHPFNEKFFCRGNGPRFQDVHNYALNPDQGFWFVAQRAR